MWAGTVGGLKGEGGRIYAQDVQLGVGLVRAADNTVKTTGECVDEEIEPVGSLKGMTRLSLSHAWQKGRSYHREIEYFPLQALWLTYAFRVDLMGLSRFSERPYGAFEEL